MPIKHVSLRQIRKDRRRALRNQTVRSALKTLKKRWLSLLAEHNEEEARRLLPEVMKRFDQAAAKGIIHKNTASHVKSRFMQPRAPGPARPATSPKRPAGPAQVPNQNSSALPET